ncbi:MAG: folylpolyglutamate synthase/dihydrofolate synthase family protein [Thermoplasmata archaeon]
MSDDAYRESLAHLYQLRRFGAQPGLDVMQGLLEALDHPERRFPSIHVAGSKGKGSVSALTAGILTAAGFRTGLFTSPHLQSYRERIQIDRHPIDPGAVTHGIERIRSLAVSLAGSGRIPRPPTFFEVTTALAFEWFAREHVDVAVIEVGLGGRLDATNVLPAKVGVITTIELEHTEVLGPTLTHVAYEKSGILHPGMRLVVGEAKEEPLREITRVAGSQGVPIWRLEKELRLSNRVLSAHGQKMDITTPHRELTGVEIPLLGNFQARNVVLAVAASDLFAQSVDRALTEEEIRKGLRSIEWRGRLELAAQRPPLFLDVAHTPESARAVAQSLVELFPFAEPEASAIVFGCLQGKRFDEMFEPLSLLARTIVLAPIRSDRSAEVEELRRAARPRFPRVVIARSAAEGLQLARVATRAEGYTVALGSDYLVGELLNALEGTPVDEPDLSDPAMRGPGQEVPLAAPRGRRAR